MVAPHLAGAAAKPSGRVKVGAKKALSAQDFLDSASVARKVEEFKKKETVFAQGDPRKDVLYIQKGGVRLSVVESGKEAVVAVLGPGDFLARDAWRGSRYESGRRGDRSDDSTED